MEVPDAVSLKTTVSDILDKKVSKGENYNTYAGLVYIYGFAYIALSKNFLLTNFLLLAVAAVSFSKVICSVCDDFSNVAIAVIFACFCFNPYVLAVFDFPNKEIPIFALLNVAIYFLLVRNNFVAAFLFLLPIYWVRDGYFWIASGTFLLCFLTAGVHKWMRPFVILTAILVFILMPVEVLGYGDSAMKRSLDTVEILRGSGVVIHADFLARLYYTILSFALFNPVFELGGKFIFLNFGYFLLGLVIVGYFGKILTRENVAKFLENDLDFILLMQILMLSFGLNIQPRYIFPLICFMVASIFSGRSNYLMPVVFITCIFNFYII